MREKICFPPDGHPDRPPYLPPEPESWLIRHGWGLFYLTILIVLTVVLVR